MSRHVTIPGQIAAGMTGGGVFIALHLILQFGLVPSLLLSLGGFGAGLMLFSRSRRELAPGGVSQAELNEVLRKGQDKLDLLEKLAGRAGSPEIQKKIGRIHRVVGKIMENFRNDPKDIRAARPFLNYFLDATLNIIRMYQQLREQNLDAREVQTSLRKVESMLDTIEAAFQRQLVRLLEDDVMDLDTEISVLEKALKMEGLEEKAK